MLKEAFGLPLTSSPQFSSMSLEQLLGLSRLFSTLMQMCNTCSAKDPRGIVSVDGDALLPPTCVFLFLPF